MIPIPNLIDAATKSTAEHLSLLRQAGKGLARYPALNVAPSPRSVSLIGNRTWAVIQCDLPRHENFPPDSGAILVSSARPGTQIGAQILAYDRRSGRAEIAVEEIPSGKVGELIIDFKWLIERCLTWLTKNGGRITNPFLLPSHPVDTSEIASNHITLSDEQLDAIKSILTNPVGYVWGPPGTGKTRHVLAETVAQLIKTGKRVLVTAPTNLAVDNALDAVLQLACVPNHQILRLGIPSAKFSRDWPECCEENALRGKLNQLEAQAQLIARRMDSKRKSEDLNALIPEQERIAAVSSKVVDELDESSRNMGKEIEETQNSLDATMADCHQAEQELVERRMVHATLKLDELMNGIFALEMDHMALVSQRQALEKERNNIGWISRLFTKKGDKLARLTSSVDGRLAEVESTLKSQRQRAMQLESQEAALRLEIEILESRLHGLVVARQKNEKELERLNTEMPLVLERKSHATADANDAFDKLAQMLEERKELLALGDFPDESAIAVLEAELKETRAKMERISQDLSEKLVLGMTLDGFIGLTMNQALRFDHIIVDEAGYAPLAKVLPLLLQGCPISLLGDHRQLPPVYEGKNDDLSESYWGVSALYLEEAFQPGIGDDPGQMVERAKTEPRFKEMRRSELTVSYRFGSQLADLLDRYFYKIGLRSHEEKGTDIRSRNCPQTGAFKSVNRENRENPAEVDRVVKEVMRWVRTSPDFGKGTLAILTPYRKQVALIQKALKKLLKSEEARSWNEREKEDFRSIEVMTVHRSQGREWDTVFFSASDTGRLAGNRPFLSDTSCPEGKLVVNTAISRSKKHLRFFFDLQFWKDRAVASLLTEVAQSK